MEPAKHICDVFYRDTTNPIVQHHIDSFDDLLTTKIPVFLKASNPLQLLLPEDNRAIRIYIGGRDGTRISYSLPVDELNNAILPNVCRLTNRTYSVALRATLEIEYSFADRQPIVRTFENVLVAEFPLMIKSKFCYLSALDPDQLFKSGECKFELGGYFIIDGGERVLLSQERLGNNLFYVNVRASQSIEAEEEEKEIKSTGEAEKVEYIAGIRCMSEDGTRGPSSHFLVIPPDVRALDPDDPSQLRKLDKESDWANFRTTRMTFITVPGFQTPVPVFSLLRALGFSSDKELYDVILAGVPDVDRTVYDDLFTQLLVSHERFVKKETSTDTRLFDNEEADLYVLRRATRNRSAEEVFYNLYSLLFPQCELRGDTAAIYRRKGYLLGHQFRMAMEAALGLTEKTDRDHFRFKRFDVSGDLCFQEFTRVFKSVSKEMTLRMDQKVHFNENEYAGERISELVAVETIGFYWKSKEFMKSFSKGFKGQWGGQDGISQILNRVSYAGAISHLRRTSLQMDPKARILNARRLHGSSFGFTCPTDVPDGRSVGMIKHLALLATVSTGSPSSIIFDILKSQPSFLQIEMIHPSTWNPGWTRVFLNGDIAGAIVADTNSVFQSLLTARRTGKIDPLISIAWNREKNEMALWSDGGRPCRPLYRPGITPADVLKLNSWDSLRSNLFDMLDAEECDTLKIEMNSFHPTNPSELHGYFMLSPLTALIPFSDHNPSPRNCFNTSQVRQTASWFHTNFAKRFDTITLLLNSPQRPIAETWGYTRYMGRGGCMPYGENITVAIAVYTGYNQEDSVLINGSAMRRGLFNTTYYHSYNITEEILDQAAGTHTIFADIAGDPKYADVKRQDNKDYSKLDATGIIRLGEEVTEETILVGILSPQMTAQGFVKGYSDSSESPKRGQRGRVDGIQVFTTEVVSQMGGGGGEQKTFIVQGVKIRIAEARQPTLGDKFGSRHGQKGTCGLILQESDMPFSARGIRPDLVMNPHAIPSRMTIGQFLESTSGKIGTTLGCLVDGTPFTSSVQLSDYRNTLVKLGLEPYGNETLYNGMTGEMIETEIFMGPTYYLCMKHMVEDKINYRDTGGKTLLTHQPLEGRSAGGGLRIGEMERDALIGHGAASFIEESFMKRSDEHEVIFQKEDGVLDSKQEANVDTTILRMPYAMSLMVHELEAMHISTKLVTMG